jgi:Zinc-finger of C2H2 type
MTFQSRSHLIKHGTSHTRKTQVISAKINTFLESFSASLENDMLGLDDGFDAGGKISAASEFDEHSVRLSVDTNPDSLEAAAAEAAFAFGNHDLPEDLMGEVPMTGDGPGVMVDSTGAPITGERLALQCDICQARLKSKSSYIQHMKRHAGLLNFRCRLCPMTLRGQVRSTLAKLAKFKTRRCPTL